jgi:hypothetical protein
MHPELMKQLVSEHVDSLRRSTPVAAEQPLAATSAAAVPGSDATRRSARRVVGELLIRSGYRLAGPGSDGRDMVTA